MLPPNDVRLFVVIPVYGNWTDTLDCLRNLAAQSSMAFHVLLADDGSPEPAPASIDGFAFVSYVRYPHRGFAGNCNAAAAEALRRGATHLLFLNSDTAFSSEFSAACLRVVQTRPDSIVSPVIFWHHDPSRIWFSGGRLSLWTPFFRAADGCDEARAVDYVSGCALIVPSICWSRLRGFDERYVTYFEDLDYTLRATREGIPVCVVPDRELRVLHKAGGSFGGGRTWPREYRMLASSLVFIRMHFRGATRVACFVLTGARLLAVLVLSLPRLPRPRLLWNAIVHGFSD